LLLSLLPAQYECADRSIVAVHGLGSDVERAWLHAITGRCEFLPDDLGQPARIMTYSHNSKSYTLRKSFDGFAKDLLEALMRVRRLNHIKKAGLAFMVVLN